MPREKRNRLRGRCYQQLILDENGTHIYLRWLKGGSKADTNIANEGQGAKGQEEQVEGMAFKVGGKY